VWPAGHPRCRFSEKSSLLLLIIILSPLVAAVHPFLELLIENYNLWKKRERPTTQCSLTVAAPPLRSQPTARCSLTVAAPRLRGRGTVRTGRGRQRQGSPRAATIGPHWGELLVGQLSSALCGSNDRKGCGHGQQALGRGG